MAKRVGLFGGTFDPVHAGHVSLVNSFLDSGIIDELWILPSPDPPHKTDKQITPFEHRKKMLQLVFAHTDKVRVNDLELKLPLPSYTIQTIQYLKQKFPETTFYLCIGGDSLVNFESWYKPDKIIEECELLVAERPDNKKEDMRQNFLEKARFVKHTPVEISGTELRKRLKNDGESITSDIPEAALTYIQENGLYKNQ